MLIYFIVCYFTAIYFSVNLTKTTKIDSLSGSIFCVTFYLLIFFFGLILCLFNASTHMFTFKPTNHKLYSHSNSQITKYCMSKKVLFFDSGIGGLSTLSSTLKLCPTLSYIYLADTKHAPFGKLTKKQVTKFTINAIKPLVQSNQIGAIVLACNTATNCAIDQLRKQFNIPIIGTEPAVLPAINEIASGKILVLATPTTIMQHKFEILTNTHKDRLLLTPMPTLATLIENYFEAPTADNKAKIINTLLSVKEHYTNISAVVLGCTHYSLIKNEISKIFQVKCFDGNLGVSNQLLRIIKNDKDFFSTSKTFPMIITTQNTKINYTRLLSELLNE